MGTTYKIKPGDNLSTIASKYNTTVGALQKANGISNPNLIYAGKTLTIPGASSPADNSKLQGTVTPGYKYTPFDYDKFAESDETKTAWGNKNTYDDKVANYGEFGFTNQEKLDEYTKKWEERPDFTYDVNGDALYQQYKDMYIQQGKMAMADTIGQASAMTGGYGNSYAATVGNQAYQAHLQKLNDVIPELYQMAYDRYNQEGQDILNTISMLKGERDFEYGVHNDEYNKLLGQQQYWGDMYLGLYDRDYGIYDSNRAFDQTEHTNEENSKHNAYRESVEDAQWKATFDESQRQFNEQMAWDKKKYEDSKITYSGGGSSSGSSSSGNNSSKGNNKETSITPKKSPVTTTFIANRQTINEWARRGKSTSDYKKYIEGEIEKLDKYLSDEEIAYLIKYYGLS